MTSQNKQRAQDRTEETKKRNNLTDAGKVQRKTEYPDHETPEMKRDKRGTFP